MTEQIWVTIGEPGFWVLAFLLGCGIATLVASIATRGTRRRFLELVNEIISEDRLTKADRALLRAEIDRSKGVHLLAASPFAPFAILGAIFVSASEGWVNDGSDEQLDEVDRELDRLHAKAILLCEGVDPRTGHYWNDARFKEIRELAFTLETWNNPVAMIWILAWLAIASPLMVLAYFVSGSLKPFIVNMWEPLRGPIVAALEAIRAGNLTHRQI